MISPQSLGASCFTLRSTLSSIRTGNRAGASLSDGASLIFVPAEGVGVPVFWSASVFTFEMELVEHDGPP